MRWSAHKRPFLRPLRMMTARARGGCAKTVLAGCTRFAYGEHRCNTNGAVLTRAIQLTQVD